MDSPKRYLGKRYLGSTDCPILLGISTWSTEDEIFRRIVFGEYKQHDEKTETMFRLAKRLEPAILDEFTHRTGLAWKKSETVFHPDFHFIGATPDGIVSDDPGQIIEAKTAMGFFNSQKKWDGGVPENYKAQCQHHMACTGARICWVPVLFGTHRFELLQVERDDEFVRDLLEIEVHWWKTRVEPALRESAA